MLKQLFTAILLVTSTYGVCSAQSDVASEAAADDAVLVNQDATKPTAADNGDSLLDATEARYRELICSRAADFANPNLESAIHLAVKMNYVDERFNAVIRQVMQEASKPDQWDTRRLSLAVRLLRLCTLSEKEQAELVFHCYLLCGDQGADRGLEQQMQRQLTLYPDETSRLVKERISQEGFPKKLLSLIQIVGESSEALLPRLLEIAESDNPELSDSAMQSIPELMNRIRKYNDQKRGASIAKEVGLEQLDPKMVKYAERIIERYDTNGDSELSPDEYGKMLMSPVAADLDQDGAVTANEYAAWMQSRARQ